MSLTPLALAALAALCAWLWLLFGWGGFWRADQRLGAAAPAPAGGWPGVVAVIPARDEAETIADAVRSLLTQDYPGRLDVVVVDDNSDDGTAAAARAAADGEGAARLHVVSGAKLAPGWTGKMWAVGQGVARAGEIAPEAAYVLLCDADIAHGRGALRRLVAKAEAGGLDLVSLMVRLSVAHGWERLLIPAFVFFFQKLYPFPWVNDPRHRVAAAAGGCMLVRRAALARIGGIAAIRDRVIDDCALAAAVKQGGPVWLGLADDSRSLRAYDGLGGIWDMVARTAFVQLRGSAWLLAGTVAGMALLYLVPPLAAAAGALGGDPPAAVAGAAGWAVMAACYRPTLALYRRPAWEAPLLPVAGLLYAAMTVDSARRSWAGRGAAWKGRSYAAREGQGK